jgi:hypothetical protein
MRCRLEHLKMKKAAEATAIRRSALTLLLIFVPLSGLAESVKGNPFSLQTLTKTADSVVIARVVSVKGEWSDDKTNIWTRVGLDVQETLKGTLKAGERVDILQLGGTVGDLSSVIPDAPSFKEGERILAFLSKKGNGNFTVLNFYQGKFSVEADPAGGVEIAVRRAPQSLKIIDRVPLKEARSRILNAKGP